MRAIGGVATASFLAALCFTSQASATPENVKRLKDTNACPGCNLKNDNLQNFYLENADLRSADLEKADLKGANLKNADLTGAKGLTTMQVKAATGWQEALYDESFRKQLGLDLPARKS